MSLSQVLVVLAICAAFGVLYHVASSIFCRPRDLAELMREIDRPDEE